MKHVEGLYALWDHLTATIPGLIIDNCASGGRRLDIELISRSITLWRSDTAFKNNAQQAIAYGINHWLPYTGLGAQNPAPEDFRSGLGTSQTYVASWYSPPGADYWAQWRGQIQKVNTAAPGHPYPFRLLFSEDFYPLSPYSAADGTFIAYQFHDSSHNVGVVLVYRRGGTATANFKTQILGGLQPGTTYCFSSWDGAGGASVATPSVAGGTLMENGLSVSIPAMPGAGVFTYAPCS